MGVTLAKGGNVSLSKAAPNLTKISVGLGWDARSTSGADFDLDASALVTGPERKVLSDLHFVFYNNLRSPDGSIEHTGDNLTGDGDGDDEVINVDLSAVPPNVTNIFFPVSIHDADARLQSFGQVTNAYIRVVDLSTGSELARYDLSEDASTETAMIFGELYRHNAEWKFRAIGQGYASGLAGIARDYGVNI
ncbi:chemical-damaging agent resistance protein C [Rhodococcus sp. SRB_17]|uniref:TerD family protein n=1 Tax=unclassified Rhodococcus (in: high G+C Gram-positive bacteria) TaxID=192944 RepID=UPI000B93C41F|nr:MULTISPECIES: TerD family protein [unclassified Rhodococcus (in: high G+C Gram-positive bacteria)]MCJ0906054.1 TerD family protein [Rhodococcus sp. ARC_M6]MDI9916360.1 TerD family protein [Rhodococcus sp. IEGM 1379]NMM89672.1 chemical-damaging agent resistance protein C [Rhodococcus sp. SRB_17]OYD71430.1 tellurium resistance protein TerD [Rhodococcus sp. OK302]